MALWCVYVQLNMSTEYEWDKAKRRINLAKRGVDFAVMNAFEWETALIESDGHADESRGIAKGFIGLHLHVVVFTERSDRTRIVSLRRARPSEEKGYAKHHRR